MSRTAFRGANLSAPFMLKLILLNCKRLHPMEQTYRKFFCRSAMISVDSDFMEFVLSKLNCVSRKLFKWNVILFRLSSLYFVNTTWNTAFDIHSDFWIQIHFIVLNENPFECDAHSSTPLLWCFYINTMTLDSFFSFIQTKIITLKLATQVITFNTVPHSLSIHLLKIEPFYLYLIW